MIGSGAALERIVAVIGKQVIGIVPAVENVIAVTSPAFWRVSNGVSR
jgi:predicted amino acid-binding ACT domain protein